MNQAGTPAAQRFAAVVLAAFLTVLLAPMTAAAESVPVPEPPSRLKLTLTQLNPREINSTSTTLNISGTVTNVGDRRISDLQVRLELGEKASSERQLRNNLTTPLSSGASISKFVDISPATLEPGQSGQLNVTVRLDGSANNLRVNSPGVYPLLVNVNGTPDYGRQARLIALNLLLPVLGAPGKNPAPPPAQPAQVTMLWPIADTRPRIVAAPYGGKAVLSDDALADELRHGGRLDALVSSALSVRDDPQVGKALCYAVDPDLLDTVDAMTRGYDVRTATGTVAGSGVDAAKAWLDSLRRLVAGQCVVQMPYADADLSSLSGVRNGDLMRYAIDTASRVQQVTGVLPLSGVLWANGPLNNSALDTLGSGGIKKLIVDESELSPGPSGAVTLRGTGLQATPADSLVSMALGTGSEQSAVGVQNGLAMLAYRGLTGDQGGPVVVTPPRRWDLPGTEFTQLLHSFGELLGRKMLTAVPLPQVLSAAPAETASMAYTARDVAAAIPGTVTNEMATIESTMADLQSAMTMDPTARVDPEQVLLPLRYALVRNTSTAWEGSSGAAETSAADSRTQLDALLGRVAVGTPEVPISMASGSAPVPVFVHNWLPVQVAVRIVLNNNTGLRSGELPLYQIPAGLGKTISIPAQALRAGKFSVTVNLSTPGGTPLGNPARFELRSNEYGVVTLILTIAGGAALVLLSARQIYRRLRARRSA
ncbi:DUF6049 family protein [Amycolatopsis rhizosphaerae]|nr:DUF6049 family protein [Amycolatopsis rhizosphaerae]